MREREISGSDVTLPISQDRRILIAFYKRWPKLAIEPFVDLIIQSAANNTPVLTEPRIAQSGRRVSLLQAMTDGLAIEDFPDAEQIRSYAEHPSCNLHQPEELLLERTSASALVEQFSVTTINPWVIAGAFDVTLLHYAYQIPR